MRPLLDPIKHKTQNNNLFAIIGRMQLSLETISLIRGFVEDKPTS